MPELDGLAVVTAVARDKLPTRVLLLSATEDPATVYEALAAGAAGYLTKESDRDEIVAAVVGCAKGRGYVPAHLAGGLATELHQRARGNATLLSTAGVGSDHYDGRRAVGTRYRRPPAPGGDDRPHTRPAAVLEAGGVRPRCRGGRGDATTPRRVIGGVSLMSGAAETPSASRAGRESPESGSAGSSAAPESPESPESPAAPESGALAAARRREREARSRSR